mmetsp:Transcript_43717/g.115310  ORF Transcript_43717/g.115310 Transcript_43717/m.115310 type:complete len:216 (-) Transcript_43717:418-1065(-)
MKCALKCIKWASEVPAYLLYSLLTIEMKTFKANMLTVKATMTCHISAPMWYGPQFSLSRNPSMSFPSCSDASMLSLSVALIFGLAFSNSASLNWPMKATLNILSKNTIVLQISSTHLPFSTVPHVLPRLSATSSGCTKNAAAAHIQNNTRNTKKYTVFLDFTAFIAGRDAMPKLSQDKSRIRTPMHLAMTNAMKHMLCLWNQHPLSNVHWSSTWL